MSAVVADVLERAAELIIERGWAQADDIGSDGRICAAMALNRATENCDIEALAYRALQVKACPRRYVSDWNDDPARTADEVITALRECAATERATP